MSEDNALLAGTVKRLEQLHDELLQISDKCEEGGEGRIAAEIKQAMRQINQTIELAGVYIRGEELPTLAEVQGIYHARD